MEHLSHFNYASKSDEKGDKKWSFEHSDQEIRSIRSRVNIEN